MARGRYAFGVIMADFSGDFLDIVGVLTGAAGGAYAGALIDFGAEAGPEDTTPPTVSDFDPAPGSRLTSRSAPVSFSVTDAGGLALVFVTVRYPGGAEEVAHDGGAFVGAFAGASTRVAIVDGWRYTLRRVGGWPEAPTIRVSPIDTSGNVT